MFHVKTIDTYGVFNHYALWIIFNCLFIYLLFLINIVYFYYISTFPNS